MFGAIGSGGAILIIVVALIVHRRGGGKLKPVKDHHIVYWGAALGLLAAGAGESLRAVGTVGTTISGTITSQSSTVGPIGAAAVAALVLLVAFGTKPAMGKDLICGVALPGILSAAGAPWVLPVTVLGGLLHGFGA